MRAMLTSTDPESYALIAESLARLDLSLALSRIGAPTLVVCGADDAAIPPAHGQPLEAEINSATMLLVPGAAHLTTTE